MLLLLIIFEKWIKVWKCFKFLQKIRKWKKKYSKMHTYARVHRRTRMCARRRPWRATIENTFTCAMLLFGVYLLMFYVASEWVPAPRTVGRGGCVRDSLCTVFTRINGRLVSMSACVRAFVCSIIIMIIIIRSVCSCTSRVWCIHTHTAVALQCGPKSAPGRTLNKRFIFTRRTVRNYTHRRAPGR